MTMPTGATASQASLDQYNEDTELFNFRLMKFAQAALAGMGQWTPSDPALAGEGEPELTSKRAMALRAAWAFDMALTMMAEYEARRKK